MKSTCPYCAEDIQAGAVRCPHCRSRLRNFTVEGWHRDQPEAMVAGVAAAVSKAFGVPVAPVRVAFVALSLVQLVGILAYVGLWLVIPKRAGEPSLLESIFARGQTAAHRLSGRSACPSCGERGNVSQPAPTPSQKQSDATSDRAA